MNVNFLKFFTSITPKDRKDLALASLVGFLSGTFAIIPLVHLGVHLMVVSALGVVLFFPSLFVLSYFIAIKIQSWFALARQIIKFASVGTLNTLLELTIVNIFFFVTGVATGIHFSLFKTFSFFAAVVNGYFWSKYWTFESKSSRSRMEFAKFLLVAGIGLALNVGIASFLVNGVPIPLGISEVLWANIAVIVAVLIVMAWNFLSQKFIIFKE